jgi:mannose-6-phosphate isomerase-like protein (cupin superfamily)
MHAVIRAHEYSFAINDIYGRDSVGYAQARLVDERHGSVHTGLTLNELAPGGEIRTHLHSFEEGFYVLAGSATVRIGDRSNRCGPGDLGVAKVGLPHSWHNAGQEPVRWLQMSAPQPKPVGRERDTFFVRHGATRPGPADDDPARPVWGHFDASQIPPVSERATSVGEGVFLKWLIDEAFGAVHHRLVFIEYQPGASIALHDHTFEESYFILSGAVHATLDGRTYDAGAGDVIWTGVGCVHAFANVGSVPVRWLETFSPQPPRENVFRFMAEWQQRGAAVEAVPAADGESSAADNRTRAV